MAGIIKFDKTKPNGERGAMMAFCVNWLHANMPSMKSVASMLNQDAPTLDAKFVAEFGCEAGQGGDLNSLIFAIADHIDDIDIADANRAFNGEVD